MAGVLSGKEWRERQRDRERERAREREVRNELNACVYYPWELGYCILPRFRPHGRMRTDAACRAAREPSMRSHANRLAPTIFLHSFFHSFLMLSHVMLDWYQPQTPPM